MVVVTGVVVVVVVTVVVVVVTVVVDVVVVVVVVVVTAVQVLKAAPANCSHFPEQHTPIFPSQNIVSGRQKLY